MIQENNQICVQGYKFATMRHDFSLIAQRALLQVVKQMQYRLQGQTLDNLNFDNEKDRKQLIFNIKAKDLLTKDCKSFEKIKKDLDKVIQATIEYEKPENELWGKSVLFTDIIYRHGEIEIRINDTIWNLFVDYAKGYKRFQLVTAMLLHTTNSLRLYELLNENTEPITYEIEWLKKMFKVENKYRNNNDFAKRIIRPAIDEINEKSEIQIEIAHEFKSYGRGRPKLYAITFRTTKKFEPSQQEKENAEIQRKYGLTAIPKEIENVLKDLYNFKDSEITANSVLIYSCYNMMKPYKGLKQFLIEKYTNAQRARNPKGYIINTLKSELIQHINRKDK